MKILVLNSGSNSLKFELIDATPNAEVPEEQTRWGSTAFSGAYDDIGKAQSKFSVIHNGTEVRSEQTEAKDYGHAAKLLFDWIDARNAEKYGLSNLSDVERIGHQVVHGANRF